MRAGLDYTKKDDVIIETLKKGLSPCALVWHEESAYDFNTIGSKLNSAEIFYAQLFDSWSPYRLYASKDKASVETVKLHSEQSWENPSKSK